MRILHGSLFCMLAIKAICATQQFALGEKKRKDGTIKVLFNGGIEQG